MEQKIAVSRDELRDFTPKLAQLSDGVFLGEVWTRKEVLSARDRNIVTVTVLMTGGILDSSLKFHVASTKHHGVIAGGAAKIPTCAAFCVGWPKAWVVLRMAKGVYRN